MTTEFLAYDPRTLNPTAINALADLQNTIRAERLPDDPPVPADEFAARFLHLPAFVELQIWAVPDGDGFDAWAAALVFNMETNRHLLQFEINVHPAHRRRGLGRGFLERIAQAALEKNRSLVMTSASSRVPAGAGFLEQYGFTPGLESRVSQLDLRELDSKLLEDWIARAEQRAAGFELGFWDGPYPIEELPAIAQLMGVMNTAPRGELEVEDFNVTPEMLRQLEQNTFGSGAKRSTAYVRERATNRFAGFTEITYHPNRAMILNQGGTGVFPAFRDRGLGRWLKAATLQRVLETLPQARFVRTGNATTNAAMLKINVALGFKPFYTHTDYQADASRVLERLGATR